MQSLFHRNKPPIASLLICAALLGACDTKEHEEEKDDKEGLLDTWALSSSAYAHISSMILDTTTVETALARPHVDVFNPGMATWLGNTWMALRVDRFEEEARLGCEVERTIVMVQLDADYQPQSDYFPLDLPHPGQACSTAEDPRLVVDGEHLYVIYNGRSLTEDDASGVRRMFFAELSMQGGAPRVMYSRQLESPHYPLRQIEKNWTPFISEKGVHLVYNTDPATVFLLPNDRLARARASNSDVGVWMLSPPTESTTAIAQSPDTYGARRGGTQAVFEPRLGQYVSFSHSSAEVGKHGQRLYFAGFYTFEATEPFNVVSYLAMPLDIPCVSPKKNGFHKVVFPTGLVDLGDHYALAFGEEDLTVGVSLIDKAQLFKELSFVP